MSQTPLEFEKLTHSQSREAAAAFFARMSTRRSVRDFSSAPVPEGVLEKCIAAAATAPSGANLQPWHFAVVRSPDLKRRLRLAAEEEERAFYQSRAPGEWLDALRPLGTDASKPYLETAPALVAVFQKNTLPTDGGPPQKTYYPKESVGIAVGFLITALHQAGLATLTHTPSPMGFLNSVLGRPASEKPFVLLVVGYPATPCTVPTISRRPLSEILSLH